MARKFINGRQDELTLNPELFNLFMTLKYINNGAIEPIQDKQAPIPIGAIWNDRSKGQDILKVNENGSWNPAFTGYYHPANLKTKPTNPVDGQIWIDTDKDNTLHVYDQNTDSWIAVKAATTTSNRILVDMHNNFMHMVNMKDMDSTDGQKTFLVPDESFGKLFDNGIYTNSSNSKYQKGSDISVIYKTTDTTNNLESWVHVNANKLYTIEKRLIKIDKTNTSINPYLIYNIFSNNTEFYILDTNGYGRLLLPYDGTSNNYDFISFDKGIELTSQRAKEADYLYTMSYSFYDTGRAGKLIKKNFSIGKSTQIYIGQLNVRPMIFLDGLYLEQSKYNYDSTTGNVEIDDTIVNNMDMMAIVFEDIETTGEKTINNITGPLTNTKVGTFTNAAKFKKPLAFVSGVMGTNIVSPNEIEWEGTTLIIKNFGPGVSDSVQVMVVEANNMYIDNGLIDSDKSIKHSSITNNDKDKYIVFIDGLLISTQDLEVSEGQIRINNAVKDQQYVLLKIKDEETTAISFDSEIMNYTLAIKNEDGTLYNECNNACLYANGKLIAMKDAIEKESLPIKGATGQIVKVKSIIDNNNIYAYYQWNTEDNKWISINDNDLITTINKMMKGSFSTGSIMLDSKGLEGKTGTYYAYTYANGVEEPLLKGKRTLIENKTEYSVNVNHNFTSKQGAFSAYIEGILCPDIVETNSNNGRFIVPTLEADEGIDPYNTELVYYVERPEKTELVSCERETLTAANRSLEYENAYVSNISLIPGVVSVFVNGVRLERNDYSIIDPNTIILHESIVGSQKNYNASDQSTWNKYIIFNKDKTATIECNRDDHITIEVRQDYSIKSQTIPVRYAGQRTFYMEDDGLPKSLILTQDLVKIYIDGVLYQGEYSINKNNGSITLLDSNLENILNIDPIAFYFDTHPYIYDNYIKKYGKTYIAKPKTNRITFEWR